MDTVLSANLPVHFKIFQFVHNFPGQLTKRKIFPWIPAGRNAVRLI